jgi:hypothetical protein
VRSPACTVFGYPISHHTANALGKQVRQTSMYACYKAVGNTYHISNLQTVTVPIPKNAF